VHRPSIAVVTPLFPLRDEPYRGAFVHATVVALQKLANVKVYCPVASYPKLPLLSPLSFKYRKPDYGFCPPGVESVTYFEYPAFPVLSRPVNAYTSGRALLRNLPADPPDLLLAYWLFPEGYGAVQAAKQVGIPCVVGALGGDLRAIPDKVALHQTRKCIQEASQVITVSEELRLQALALGGDPKKVRTILNGCDRSIFYPSSRQVAREQLGVARDSELVLYVGHLIAAKGLRELVGAIQQLAPHRPKIQLVMVGEGRLADELSATVQQNGLSDRVHFPGICSREQVAKWMTACNVFCLPSYSEGCPNVVLEALSCDRPVVATDVGGIPEIVSSQCGYLVPPQNVDRLAQALQLALDKDWHSDSIAQTSQRGWDTVAEETLSFCMQLLPQAAPNSEKLGCTKVSV
jgi:teichuronic acid biosynthesis glycosyltransferase TuaC